VFDEWIETACTPARMLYATPSMNTTHRGLRLNMGTPSFMRAPGENPGCYAMECAMDELAWNLGMDPLQLRLVNYAENDPGQQKPFSSKSLRQCYAQGAERFGWSRRPPRTRAMREGRELIGWGMATSEYPAHQGPASARAAIDASGHVLVQAGTQDIGTGTYTVMTQIAAHQLGLSPSQVTFELGDTDFPETPVSGGSQTAASTGSAVMLASQALADKLKALAAGDAASPLHGVATADLELQQGHIRSGKTKQGEPLTALVRRNGGQVHAEVQVKPAEDREKYSTYAFGAYFGEVAVDEDLGTVRVRRFVAAVAAGHILNAKTARSQIHGGVIMGIGQALMEQGIFDSRHGRLVNMDLAEYLVPVNADTPPIEVIFIPEEDRIVNPAGIKGIGEIGIVSVAAVISNAVYHAIGRRVRDLPITLDKILLAT
jgi:xanthine dehydrogenase YagR molybdenum-binding subunit